MPLISPFSKPLSTKEATHLFRRATFGVLPTQIKQFSGISADAATKILLQIPPIPAPPLNPDTGKTFHDQPFDQANQGKLQNAFKQWFCGVAANQQATLIEKMVLFWQNHFVVAFNTVNDTRYMYDYHTILRKNALGNFKTMVIEITKCPAMLQYLNGDTNEVGKPNENYARELMELFTIGRGNYTEDDVKAAAKVLTGWRDFGNRDEKSAAIGTTFTPTKHDSTNKQFSNFYQNTVIQGKTGATSGDLELNDLVDMILKQPETARFIVRKFYRFFVNFDITPQIENEFIEPLAAIFRQNNYNILPVISTLFQSEHFFDNSVRACIIKSPLDLIIGTFRFFNQLPPDSTKDLAGFYDYTTFVNNIATVLQQAVFDQPTVFGWKPYYDTGFYEIWINSTTLAFRSYSTDVLIYQGVKTGNTKAQIDTIAFAQSLTTPSDPVKLLDELTANLFATDIVQKQKDFLIDTVLMAGVPRYEWYKMWIDFANNPTNTMKRNVVKGRLDLLMIFMLRMAEYQMM